MHRIGQVIRLQLPETVKRAVVGQQGREQRALKVRIEVPSGLVELGPPALASRLWGAAKPLLACATLAAVIRFLSAASWFIWASSFTIHPSGQSHPGCIAPFASMPVARPVISASRSAM